MQGENIEQLKKGAVSFESELPFLVTASHELKSPLALVRQLAFALEDSRLTESERARIAKQILLTSERALRLTTDLAKSARLEDSLFELEPLNPQQICEEVVHEMLPLYKAKNREIRVASRYRPMLAVANKDLLRRIILNFADNALHYAEADTPVELRAGAQAHKEKIRLSVRDYGPAVPADMWRRLQASLGNASQPLHMRPQSSGLGLFVAGQFARAMQGEIGATRHRDGATFYVDVTASAQLSLL
ncbi:MAG TPA: HAMP domain-containing sensor histidine kinase [Candidatus Saccharimonadales bacterium]|nr:HAMP domain-containing sensor histidine kinase [Candidatus Saccharimonadales bacterium]